ncbi:MAG TPA: hypothetical protein VEO54_05125 [Thermoanaerobaculia bacterium]|nr:hypothetical protein [Thermoanaerobaculia bacterium]
MPIAPAAPRFPLRETLARFFRLDPRSRIPLDEAARLAGTTTERFRALLLADGAHDSSTSIPWPEAAAYLFDAWPRARILDALGPGFAEIIPPDFRLTRVDWSLPIFLVRALGHQAARVSHARGIDDYVADLLYCAIEPETLDAFRDDREFLRAFHFPVLD